jgi:outer membrane scaffolding protein for murein synthesis (MipA/OmpV family)
MRLRIVIVLLCGLLAENAFAEGNYWQMGLGLSYLRLPHYLGSNESKNYILPFPHVVVKSKYLSVDRNLIEGHFLSSAVFKLDVSFSAAFKVDSDDNGLRQGMPDLDYIIESGPSLNWLIAGKFNSTRNIVLKLPIRAAFTTDFKRTESIGWRIAPSIHWYNEWRNEHKWEVTNTLRLLYAAQDYHAYLYSVDSTFALAGRPTYTAEKGYGGWQYKFILKYKKANRTLGVFFTYSNIVHAVYRDSPLVVENTDMAVGVYASWTLWRGKF